MSEESFFPIPLALRISGQDKLITMRKNGQILSVTCCKNGRVVVYKPDSLYIVGAAVSSEEGLGRYIFTEKDKLPIRKAFHSLSESSM